MKNMQQIKPEDVDWIIYSDDCQEISKRGIGFYRGQLIYWKGLAQPVTLARSIQLHNEIYVEAENTGGTWTSINVAVLRWMRMIQKALAGAGKLLPPVPASIFSN